MRVRTTNRKMSHQTISFIKSIIRIVGYILLGFSIPNAIAALVASEIIGIIEEVGEK